jgi:hypothetical protein
MPAKDIYHNIVIESLKKDGWLITDDPFKVKCGTKDLYIDLGAEKLIAAEKGQQKIAVEIKSFNRDFLTIAFPKPPNPKQLLSFAFFGNVP